MTMGNNVMIESLLVNQTKAEFLENYFLRLPYAQPQGCRDLVQRDAWELVECDFVGGGGCDGRQSRASGGRSPARPNSTKPGSFFRRVTRCWSGTPSGRMRS